MGDGKDDVGDAALAHFLGGDTGGAQEGAAVGLAHDLEVFPTHALGEAGAEGFGGGFFGGDAAREVVGLGFRVRVAGGFALFALGAEFGDEAVAKTLQIAFDVVHARHIEP